jgi:hypothetical protein
MSVIDLHSYLLGRLPDYAHEYIAGALAGRVQDVEHLIVAAPNEKRPMVLLALHRQHGDGHPAACTALEMVWTHDHHHLVWDLGRSLAWQMLKLNGTRPAGLPKTITLYRGGMGHPALIKRGWSWTTDKRVAAFFIKFWERRVPEGAPCLLRVEVPSTRIVHTTGGRDEAEMIIFGAKKAVVDGTPDEWERLAQDLAAARKSVGVAAQ